MKNIVFIGNSPAVIKAVEEIRAVDSDVSITIVTDGFYSYSRQKLSSYLAKVIKEKQTLCHPESFYKDNRVHVITDQTIARFNFRRNVVIFENKDQLEYDVLVLADCGTPRWPAIKGTHKQGIYNGVRLKDVKALAEQSPFIETAVVQLTGLSGFGMLCALSSLGKEVVASMPTSSFLNGILDGESASLLKQLLEQSGIRLLSDNPIEEILGDAEAKAVRLKSGKVFATDAVVLDDLRLDTRLVKESGLELAQADSLRTNMANVYLIDAFLSSFRQGDGSDYATSEHFLVQQGLAVAQDILGRTLTAGSYVDVTEFALKGLRGFWAGRPRLLEGGREFLQFEAQTNVYRKIFTDGTALTGAVFFNAPQEECARVITAIEQKTAIHGIEERLLVEGFQFPELFKAQA